MQHTAQRPPLTEERERESEKNANDCSLTCSLMFAVTTKREIFNDFAELKGILSIFQNEVICVCLFSLLDCVCGRSGRKTVLSLI